jgi:hypothetical protein
MRILNLPEPEPPSRSRVITAIAILQRLLDELPPSPPTGRGRLKDIESTRGQREPAIVVMKRFYPPDGRRPRGVSIAALTKRINREPEFKDRNVSEDTVRLADFDIKGALKK